MSTEEAIIQNAQGPKKVVSDGATVEQHSIKDQIEADKYVNSKSAVGTGNLGAIFKKLKPSGTI